MNKTILLVLALSCLSANSPALGIYGNTSYFNFTYNKVAGWPAFAGADTFAATVDGMLLTFINCSSAGPDRLKGGYAGAVRCESVELPLLPSLGYLSFYLQNGSAGTTRNIYLKIWDEPTSAWIVADTIAIGGSENTRITPSSVLSKKPVKLKIDSDGQYFWFYQLEAWSSKLETGDLNEGPAILSIGPDGGSVVSSNGTVQIQFDEMVQAGTGAVTFSGAGISAIFGGNTLRIDYTGLTNPSGTLMIPAGFVINNAGVSMTRDTSVNYVKDVTGPAYLSASPAGGSFIVINDVLQKITLAFDEQIRLGTGTISFGPANVTPSVSGNTLVISYSGLSYDTPYTLTVPAGMISDISGNAYKNDIVLSYTTYPKDDAAPLLVSQSVPDDDMNVPVGGSIFLTFNEIVKIAGAVTLNGTPVTVSVNGPVAGINYTGLDYNTSYTVRIGPGAIADTTGNSYAGVAIHFTTRSLRAKAFDAVVAKDGSGNYATIQEAVNAAPDHSTDRFLIFIRNGIYNEKVTVPSGKQNLSLIGQDSAKTVIAYNDYAGGTGGTDNSYTINIQASGFYMENITVRNTWHITGGSANQAVALMTEGDRQVFKNCQAFSFQDTHYSKQADTRQYYLNCFIEGATDFMFGGATAYFEGCTINCVKGGQYITAPSGNSREFGLVYNHCIIIANSDVASQTYYLGRPWKDHGKTVWLNTGMGRHIKDTGWAMWTTSGDDADNHLTGFYAEYNSMDLAGLPINPVRAYWGVKLTPAQAFRYTVDQVFNFGSGSGTWNPLPFCTEPNQPSDVLVAGNKLSWTAPDHAAGYLIFRNDELIASTTDTAYTDTITASNQVAYAVKAYNEYGAQSASAAGVATGIKKRRLKTNGLEVYPNPFQGVIKVKSDVPYNILELYTFNGQLIHQVSDSDTIDASHLDPGLYVVKVVLENGEQNFIKMVKP